MDILDTSILCCQYDSDVTMKLFIFSFVLKTIEFKMPKVVELKQKQFISRLYLEIKSAFISKSPLQHQHLILSLKKNQKNTVWERFESTFSPREEWTIHSFKNLYIQFFWLQKFFSCKYSLSHFFEVNFFRNTRLLRPGFSN